MDRPEKHICIVGHSWFFKHWTGEAWIRRRQQTSSSYCGVRLQFQRQMETACVFLLSPSLQLRSAVPSELSGEGQMLNCGVRHYELDTQTGKLIRSDSWWRRLRMACDSNERNDCHICFPLPDVLVKTCKVKRNLWLSTFPHQERREGMTLCGSPSFSCLYR